MMLKHTMLAAAALVAVGPGRAARYYQFQFASSVSFQTCDYYGKCTFVTMPISKTLNIDTAAIDPVVGADRLGVSFNAAAGAVSTPFFGNFSDNFQFTYQPNQLIEDNALHFLDVNGSYTFWYQDRNTNFYQTGPITYLAGRASDKPTGSPELISRIDPPLSAPVPEATIWAMMVAGFGMVGSSMRRRSLSISQRWGSR